MCNAQPDLLSAELKLPGVGDKVFLHIEKYQNYI